MSEHIYKFGRIYWSTYETTCKFGSTYKHMSTHISLAAHTSAHASTFIYLYIFIIVSFYLFGIKKDRTKQLEKIVLTFVKICV